MPAILLANYKILIEVCSYIYLEMSFVYIFGNLIIRLPPPAFTKVLRIISRKCWWSFVDLIFGINLVGFLRALLMSCADGQLVKYGKLSKRKKNLLNIRKLLNKSQSSSAWPSTHYFGSLSKLQFYLQDLLEVIYLSD